MFFKFAAAAALVVPAMAAAIGDLEARQVPTTTVVPTSVAVPVISSSPTATTSASTGTIGGTQNPEPTVIVTSYTAIASSSPVGSTDGGFVCGPQVTGTVQPPILVSSGSAATYTEVSSGPVGVTTASQSTVTASPVEVTSGAVTSGAVTSGPVTAVTSSLAAITARGEDGVWTVTSVFATATAAPCAVASSTLAPIPAISQGTTLAANGADGTASPGGALSANINAASGTFVAPLTVALMAAAAGLVALA